MERQRTNVEGLRLNSSTVVLVSGHLESQAKWTENDDKRKALKYPPSFEKILESPGKWSQLSEVQSLLGVINAWHKWISWNTIVTSHQYYFYSKIHCKNYHVFQRLRPSGFFSQQQEYFLGDGDNEIMSN